MGYFYRIFPCHGIFFQNISLLWDTFTEYSPAMGYFFRIFPCHGIFLQNIPLPWYTFYRIFPCYGIFLQNIPLPWDVTFIPLSSNQLNCCLRINIDITLRLYKIEFDPMHKKFYETNTKKLLLTAHYQLPGLCVTMESWCYYLLLITSYLACVSLWNPDVTTYCSLLVTWPVCHYGILMILLTAHY